MITFFMRKDEVDALTDSLAAAGYSERSRFIRDAIADKLRRAGIRIPRGFGLAPTRAGKADKYPAPAQTAHELNDELSSTVKPATPGEVAGQLGRKYVGKLRKRKPGAGGPKGKTSPPPGSGPEDPGQPPSPPTPGP